MDKLRSLELFLTTVETNSFVATAKQHATDPSTVSKAIKRLEETLGIQLFQRSTRRLQLTSTGTHYANTARNLLRELALCEDTLKNENDTPQGLLRINLPVTYGRVYMQPILIAFAKKYPQIQLDISFDDAYVDIIGKGIDVSIRSGTLTDNRLIAQKLSPIDFITCASPEYLRKNSLSFDEEFLHLHPWIRFRFKQTGKLMNFVNTTKIIEPSHQIIVDDGEAMAELCAAGLGLMQVPHFLVKPWIIDGSIVSLKGEEKFNLGGVYLVYSKQDFLPKRTRLFIDFAKKSIQALGETPHKTWVKP